MPSYAEVYRRSLADPEGFWAEEAQKLQWDRPWDRVLDWSPPFAHWFVGGRLNASVQCLDRHVAAGRGGRVALHWEGEPGDRQTITYGELHRRVNAAAWVLQEAGVKDGDAVVLYLPMVPELPVFMLACARIGAVHSVVFSGFSAQSLAERINELGAKVLVTADGAYRRGKVLPLKDIADQAMSQAPALRRCIVVRRTGSSVAMQAGRDAWLDDLLPQGPVAVAPASVDAEHPLFVLFTSGTTGKPKGVVHSTGGYMVFCVSTHRWTFDLSDESVYWCTADIGWVAAHSSLVYGPMALGVTQVMYEGAPDYPSPERWWEIAERYGVTVLYTSPTAIRMFMAQAQSPAERHNLTSLRVLGTVGEPINPEAWRWYHERVGGGRCTIVDTWWQTETGSIMIAGTPGIEPLPQKPGAAGPPLPGVDAVVLDNDGRPLPAGQRGQLFIRRPWPGMLQTLLNNPERYAKAYWSRHGMFYTGDYTYRDEDGYFWLLGRADEVLKVAGHRIGTAELESAAVAHGALAEAAAVDVEHPIKGSAIVLFGVLTKGREASDALRKELQLHIRKSIGPIAAPEQVLFVRSLPKTRSGKIMRRVLRAVASGTGVGDTTTLEDEGSVEEALRAYRELQAQMV